MRPGRIVSSPYDRCVQTVEPLARSLGTAVEKSDDLAEGAGLRALDVARHSGAGAVRCTHGDVLFELIALLNRQGTVAGGAHAGKGSVWAVEFDGDRPVAARYLPAPD